MLGTKWRCRGTIAVVSLLSWSVLLSIAFAQPQSPPPLPPPPPPPGPPPENSHPPPPLPPNPSKTRRNRTPQESPWQEEFTLKKTQEAKYIVFIALPIVGVVLFLAVTSCAIAFRLRRANNGIICCLKSNLSYRLHGDEAIKDGEEDEEGLSPPTSGTPPPEYAPTTAGPPVYRDALQDVILSTRSVGSEYLLSISDNGSLEEADGTSDDQPAILHVSPITVEATSLAALEEGEGSLASSVHDVNEPLIVS